MKQDNIRIAISGGGLAGASLLHALLPYQHLDVHIFESAPAFQEAGAAVGVTRNAQNALRLIGPSAAQCLDRAGAVRQRGFRSFLAQGESQGTMVFEMEEGKDRDRITSIVHRAAFLRELLSGTPEERMHVSKKLQSVDQKEDGTVVMHFMDGTTHECDILVGADGIHSTVRKLILGEDDPAAHPVNSGHWGIFTLTPYDNGRALIGTGPVDVDNAREYGWTGDHTFMMHNLLNQGELMQFIAGAYEEAAVGKTDLWKRDIPADELRKLYQGWPSHLQKTVEELLCKEAQQNAFYLFEHPHARTYASARLCVMGDAAHATTPWQASGAGMSLEDSLILSSLLGHARTRAEAEIALKAYDEVRRPRTQCIVDSSRLVGSYLTGTNEDTYLDIEKLRQKLPRSWDFVFDLDMAKHRDDAFGIMDQELQRTAV